MNKGSVKNSLQEWCQLQLRSNLKLPQYTFKSCNNGWSCTVQVPIEMDKYETFRAEAQNKKEASKLAAKLALDYIESAQSKEERKLPEKKDCTVLVDLENAPTCSNVSDTLLGGHVEAFVGKLSSHANKDLLALYPFVDDFHIIDSGIKDAVDHAISVRAGIWLAKEESQQLIIVTRDKFGYALRDVLVQLQLIAGSTSNTLSIQHKTSLDLV